MHTVRGITRQRDIAIGRRHASAIYSWSITLFFTAGTLTVLEIEPRPLCAPPLPPPWACEIARETRAMASAGMSRGSHESFFSPYIGSSLLP